MRVLLVYPNITDYPIDISYGLAALSAVLKKSGHTVALFDSTFGSGKKVLASTLETFRPEITGIPVASNDFDYAVELSAFIKEKLDIPIVAGGFHVTMAPEDIMAESCFDIAVIGEGEQTFLEVVETIEKNPAGYSLHHIPGIWFRKQKTIVRNPLRKLNQDINVLPFPDKNLFDYKRYVAINRGLATFITSYGCPFDCSYCINKVLKDTYGSGGFVRYKSVDYLINEILTTIQGYNIREIEFYDDTFTIHKQRLLQFCEQYTKKIGLPFYINSRVDTLTREVVSHLKSAGCVRISMGIETGDPFVRNEICKRNQTDKQIIEAFALVREFGIKTLSYNMVGIPYETTESIQKTIELNRQCRPDFIAVSIFNAFKGTEIYDLCRSNGWLRADKGMAYFQTSNISHPNFTLPELKKIRDSFGYQVFKNYNYKRALIELLDKKMIQSRVYQQCRSYLIKHGIKKYL